nr:hypothetical protein [Tanacetum cinerariifolium]
MSSLTPNRACFFAKASESINWLWHKRLSHLNFETIKLAKQNKVFGLPSLVYSKDKPRSACEKGKHERASFKTKQKFSIKKCLHLLHMDLFRQVSQMYINHEKYTLVTVDGYSRMVENQNNVKVKQIRTNNRVEFRNSKFESFCDEKGISLNFSSPYTPEQNGVAERKNTTLIEATRTMLNGLDHLGKFDAKVGDGYLLWYSFVSKAFRDFNKRRQQIEKTYHVTFDESMETIRFTNTSVDKTGVSDSSRYPPDEFLQEDDPSRLYQANYDISYYITSHGRSLTELTKDNHDKKDELGTVIRNKARLVAQGFSQVEGIDYDETFAPVTRMEAIRIFLAYATYMNFIVFQIDVKIAFLDRKLKKVYVKQPHGFQSSEFPDYVCKLDKALYRL